MGYKYKTLIEFKNDYPSEYRFLYKKNLLSKLCEDMGWSYNHKKPNGYWTKKRCMEEALKFNLKTEWKRYSCSSHIAAIKNGWYDECTAHMRTSKFFNNIQQKLKNVEFSKLKKIKKDKKPNGYWTKERCLEEARKHSFKNLWKKNSNSSYRAAKKNGWYEECIAHMVEVKKPNGYWTKKRCMEEALKYKTRNEWRENSSSSHYSAKENGWLDECTTHMKK